MLRSMNTLVKARIAMALDRAFTHGEVARMAGVHRVDCSREIGCTERGDCKARHSPTTQEAIAKAVRIPVAELFGRHAWFRFAAKGLKRRRVA